VGNNHKCLLPASKLVLQTCSNLGGFLATLKTIPFYLQDMFEKVNKAYEFLCTKSAKVIDGPDPENIILILKTQSILFNRHKDGKQAVMRMFYVHCFSGRCSQF